MENTEILATRRKPRRAFQQRRRLAIQGVGWLLVLTLVSSAAARQDKPTDAPTEMWEGALDLGAAELRLEFHLKSDEKGAWSGKMISIDQGNTEVPLDRVEHSAEAISFEIKKLQLNYKGKMSDDGQQLQGTLEQFGRPFPLTLTRGKASGSRKHVETWQGTMQAGTQQFDFQIRILQAADGSRVARFDSLSEHLPDLGLRLTETGDSFRFELPATQAAFAGTVNAEKTKIVGEWLQAEQRIPLTFTKVDVAATKTVDPPNRPQTPKKPYPYEEREVEFENAADQVRLAGTLTVPRGTGPFPAAVLISGSGPQDRDESLLQHKPFWILADHLTRAGVAVLRYDDRGAGKSTGNFAAANSQDFARDAGAAVEFLKGQQPIDPDRIGLIGHSEGGLIGPLVASQRDDIAFVVMLAGTGVNGREILLNQTELISRAEKMPDNKLQRELASLREVLELACNGKSAADNQAALSALVERQWAELTPQEQKDIGKEVLEGQFKVFQSPWMQFFLTYDPKPTLAQVKCPTLVLNGQLDLQVDPRLNLPAIRSAFEAAGKKNFEIEELPGLNHLFQTATTGSPSEYAKIEETMAPQVLSRIVEFIQGERRPASQ